VRGIEALRFERRLRHDRRQSLAFSIACLPALMRFQARLDKSWVPIVKAAMREPADVRARLAEHHNTPVWAAQVLRTPLAADRPPTQERAAADLDPNVVSEKTLNALKAQYAVLSPRRKAA
jgi:hypothetical protein